MITAELRAGQWSLPLDVSLEPRLGTVLDTANVAKCAAYDARIHVREMWTQRLGYGLYRSEDTT